jgi:hypothetical protein
MRTRPYPTPPSIKIVATIFVLDAAMRIFVSIRTAPLLSPQTLVLAAFGIATLLYCALSLWRLSRWPIVLHTALTLVDAVAGIVDHDRWRWGTPIWRPALEIGILALFLVFTLPDWRQMNWALFGRPYQPAENRPEVTA